MDDEQYIATQSQLLLLAKIVKDMDLVGFVSRINKAESIGPILDPTQYIQAQGNLEKIKNLATSLRIFQLEVQKQVQERQP